MIISLEILSENGDWLLTANYDEEKLHYYGVSLKNPIDKTYWDNPSFLYEELAPMVRAMYEDQYFTQSLTDYTFKVFEWLSNNKEQIEELNEILQYSIKLGWNKIK